MFMASRPSAYRYRSSIDPLLQKLPLQPFRMRSFDMILKSSLSKISPQSDRRFHFQGIVIIWWIILLLRVIAEERWNYGSMDEINFPRMKWHLFRINSFVDAVVDLLHIFLIGKVTSSAEFAAFLTPKPFK